MEKFNPKKTRYLAVVNAVLKIFFHEKKSEYKLDIKNTGKILIIDFSLIGDIVMLVPFLKTIKQNAPDAKVTLVCHQWGKSVLSNQGLVDRFVIIRESSFNSLISFLHNIHLLKKSIKRINSSIYDYAIEMKGDLRYILFMHFCQAKRKVSYNYTGGEYLLTDIVYPSVKAGHLVEEKLYLASCLGCEISSNDIYPRLRVGRNQSQKGKIFLHEENINNSFIIGVHPGASRKNKQWDGFKNLIIRLYRYDPSFCFIIFKGPNEENAVDKIVNHKMLLRADIHISESDLSDYMGRLSYCDLVICNDSGAGHLAAAYGIPVFVIFGPVLPELSRPYAKDKVYTFSHEQQCKPCNSPVCNRNYECLKSITSDEVFEKIRDYIENVEL